MSKLGKVMIVLAVILLAAAFTLFACGKKQESKAENQPAATGAPSSTPAQPGGPAMMPGQSSPSGGSKTGASPQGTMPPAGTSPHGAMPGGSKVERKIVVPKEVAAKWKGVKITVAEKKSGGKSNTYTVNLNENFTVPSSKLTIKVDTFLPNFTMSGGEITSVSNEPKNPACYMVISEGGKEAGRSWLFANFPDMHPFDHPQYKIILVGGVPKS